MKKFILIISVYAAIIFGLGFLFAGIFIRQPVLVEGHENAYSFFQGLRIFLVCLPGVCLSGFTVTCAVIWQKTAGNTVTRFSQGMMGRYKFVLCTSLALVFILSLNEEIFKKSVENKIEFMENAPNELRNSIMTANRLLAQNKPHLAFQYAKRAEEIAPKNQTVKSLVKSSEDAIEFFDDNEAEKNRKIEKINKPLHRQDEEYTILELLRKSDEAAAKKQWFDAHYHAQLAVEACDGKNTNLESAVEKANYAWKMLNTPAEYNNSEKQDYYRIKKEGYSAFTRGDFIKSYYTFLTLKNNYPEAEDDPDVKRFFSLSKEDVENQFFFLDETENMNELSDSHKIYFSLDYPDGSKNVFYISSAMDIKKEGSLIRYLEDFYVIHYDENNRFEYSMYVPYAKATAHPVSEFGDTNLLALGMNKKWHYVPVITLQALDRDSEGILSKPVYSFTQSGLPESITGKSAAGSSSDSGNSTKNTQTEPKNQSLMILPMSFSDFHLINEASSGPERMSLPALNRFLPHAVRYGFSKEVFTENLVQRGTFPFIILIMFIFCACVGWNYRIEDPKAVFKFKWVIFVPVFGFLMIILFSMALYFFTMLNYIFVGLFGSGAIVAATLAYILMFAGMTLIFLSRKA